MDFTHLLYVRKYSIFTNKNELYVYGVATDDIFHVMGEMLYRSETHIERIDFVKLTSENREIKFRFWKENNKEILTWHNKY